MIQHEQPADTSNWLPAPAAPFRPVMRLYQPQAAVLDGSYKIPRPSPKRRARPLDLGEVFGFGQFPYRHLARAGCAAVARFAGAVRDNGAVIGRSGSSGRA